MNNSIKIQRTGNKITITDKSGKATKKDILKVAKQSAEMEFEKMLKKAKIPFKRK